MKKKILAIAFAAILAVTAITGASLAYLQDTDTEDNVFTVGNVEIDLYENFVDESKLLPAVYDATNKEYKNAVEKEVFVTNTGSEDAYVRVHIAIPSILDDAQPNFDASKNMLHFNFDMDNVVEGKWNWSNATDGNNYPKSADEWNAYKTTIDGVAYNVYVVTYEAALTKDRPTTESAMNQVYLDPKATNEIIAEINETLKKGWHIYVAAEGVQASGFNNAYEALNTAFGTPVDNYDIDWTAAAGVDTSKG